MKFLIKTVLAQILKLINPWIPIHDTRHTQSPVTFTIWFFQKIIGINRKAYWPVHFTRRRGGAGKHF